MDKKKLLLGDLNEKLGVPDNLIEISREIFIDFINELRETSEVRSNLSIERNKKVTIKVSDRSGYNIADFKFHSVTININAEVDPQQIAKVQMVGLGFAYSSQLSSVTQYKYSHTDPDMDNINLEVRISGLKTTAWGDVYESFITYNRAKLISSLPHELMHAYTLYKKGSNPASNDARYATFASFKTGLSFIDEMLYLLYFTEFLENLVRPPEFASLLKDNNVSKKSFKQFLLDSELYQILKAAQTFDYDELKNFVKSNPAGAVAADAFLTHTGINTKGFSDDAKVERMFQIVFMLIKNNQAEVYRDLLKSTITKAQIAQSRLNNTPIQFSKMQEEAWDSFISTLNKFKDDQYDEYFRYQQKLMNRKAEKTIRKVAKLFDYLDA